MSHKIVAVALSLATGTLACSHGGDTAPPSDGGADGGAFSITWRQSPPVAPVFIGSGGFAYAFGSATVSAAAPNGMAKVGPDTSGPWGTVNFLHYSGYWYGDNIIQGFSHLHLHGTGATDYGVLGVMPTGTFGPSQTTAAGYQSTFAKASESAVPGRYAVTLDQGNIGVEITATTHAAHHRYTYPAGATTAHVIFDLDHHLDGGTIMDADLTLDPAQSQVSGRLRSIGGMSGGFGGYDVFFAARSLAPWTESQVWQGGAAPAPAPITATTTITAGTAVGFELGFDLSSQPGPVEIQVGLSLVSAAEAAANLAAEMPAFAFDTTQQQTEAAWSAILGRVTFTGGNALQQAMATAAMYHAFLMPTIQSDVDGSFMGMDGMVHTASGYNYLSDMSLWDTYRTLNPLYSLIAPDRALDTVQSLTAKADESGYFPKWPIATGEAGTMIGASAELVISDAYQKGITAFDAEGAYGILSAAAMDATTPPGGRGGRNQVVPYMMYGYVNAETGDRSASLTTEYANEDFALSALAAGLGHSADAATLQARAIGYRKLYDPVSGFLWSKNADGSWATSHADPTNYSAEFAEANAWQSLWMVGLDSDGLAQLAGGQSTMGAPPQPPRHARGHARSDVRADHDRLRADRLHRPSHQRRPAPLLLGRQRARPERGLPLRPARPPRPHPEVGRLAALQLLHAGRRRAAGQRRRRDHVGVVPVELARHLPGGRQHALRGRGAALPPRRDRRRRRHLHHRRAGGVGHQPLRAVGHARRRAPDDAAAHARGPEGGRHARLRHGAGAEHLGTEPLSP